MNCRDCKHWNRGYAPYIQENWGWCRLAEPALAESAQTLATVVSDGAAALKTHADFGCVQFEAKEVDG